MSFLRKLLLLGILILVGCRTGEVKKTSSKTHITVMTFNVENLFDTKDDAGKSDETYLPLTKKTSKAHKAQCKKIKVKKWRNQCLHWDWSEDVLAHKIQRLSETIRQVNDGKGPDLVVLQEVENIKALTKLNNDGDLDYPTVVLLEGDDLRGIDVAMLSRLPLKNEAKLHRIAFSGFPKARVYDTRGILQADFSLPGGETLTVLGVHFPAPFHPTKMREQAFDRLNELARSLPKDRLILAAGDFNVASEEDKRTNITLKKTKGLWTVGHKVACKDCKGTNYYPPKDSWSFLDMIMWSNSLKTGAWQVVPDSFHIANAIEEQKEKKGFPKEYNPQNRSGVSDHWPLTIDLKAKGTD